MEQLKAASQLYQFKTLPVYQLEDSPGDLVRYYSVSRSEHDEGTKKELPNAQYQLNHPPKEPVEEDTFDFGEEETAKVEEKEDLRFANYQLVYSRDNDSIKMSDFEIVNQIGKGSISVVYLVKRKSDNQPFAMKCIKKELILDDNLFTSTKLEKDILTRVRPIPF